MSQQDWDTVWATLHPQLPTRSPNPKALNVLCLGEASCRGRTGTRCELHCTPSLPFACPLRSVCFHLHNPWLSPLSAHVTLIYLSMLLHLYQEKAAGWDSEAACVQCPSLSPALHQRTAWAVMQSLDRCQQAYLSQGWLQYGASTPCRVCGRQMLVQNIALSLAQAVNSLMSAADKGYVLSGSTTSVPRDYS